MKLAHMLSDSSISTRAVIAITADVHDFAQMHANVPNNYMASDETTIIENSQFAMTFQTGQRFCRIAIVKEMVA